MNVYATCPICKQRYIMGETGVVGGCDTCLGIQRDRNGYAWYPDEKNHVYQDVNTCKVSRVRRRDAFGGEK